jgi:cell division protein FtsL
MKKLLIITLTLGLVSAKAQDTIKIPMPIAKQIVKDLVECDSLKAIHLLTVEHLTAVEQKVLAQDTLITTYKSKVTDYKTQISAEQQKTSIWQDQHKAMTKKYKKLKATLTFTRITLSAAIGFLGYLYITK